MAAAILRFRSRGGVGIPVKDLPEAVLPAASGIVAELHIDGVFPRATCLVQPDLDAIALRWTHEHFISLYCIHDLFAKVVHLDSSARSDEQDGRTPSHRSPDEVIHV
eukprot:2470479-Prymnesium_polylepis.1